jgi:hypothetical protein
MVTKTLSIFGMKMLPDIKLRTNTRRKSAGRLQAYSIYQYIITRNNRRNICRRNKTSSDVPRIQIKE